MLGWIYRIWALALAVPLGAHAYVGWFSRYASDDFCTADVAVTRGFLSAQTYWYSAWSGRYTFTALVSALELLGGWTSQVLPSLGVVAWVAAGTWALLPVARHNAWPHAALASFVLAELVAFGSLTAAPNVGQSFYWQTGLLTYTLPLILATLFAGWIARQVLRTEARVSGWRMAASFVGSFVIGGLSESSLMIQAVALSLGLAFGMVMLRGPRRQAVVGLLAPALLASALAGGVMLLAPGTRVRASVEQDPEINLARVLLAVRASVTLAVWVVRRFEVLSRGTTVFIVVSCCALGFAAWRRLSWPRRGNWRTTVGLIAVAAVVGFGLEALSLFPVYLVQGFDPPGRVQLLAEFVLVIALGMCAYWGGGLLALASSRWHRIGVWRWIVLVGLGSLAIVPLAEAIDTFRQVPVEAAYAAAWDVDDRVMRLARTDSPPVAVVDPLAPRWGWAYVDTHPGGFPNGCVARYYGLQQVVASGPAPVWAGAPEKGGKAPGG